MKKIAFDCRQENVKFQHGEMKRSFATQCDSTRRDTGMQTKRLSKDEMRYYTKVIEKEKEVLMRFLKATKDEVQFHDKVVLGQLKTKLSKNLETKRIKLKKKNKRKHSSSKAKNSRNSAFYANEENAQNKAHYVSKILVDDSTKSLKISFKPCDSKTFPSSKVSKENDVAEDYNERTRTRKSKRPRRYDRTEYELDTSPENEENNVETRSPVNNDETVFPLQKPPSPGVRIKIEPKDDSEDEENEIHPSMVPIFQTECQDSPGLVIKPEIKKFVCSLKSNSVQEQRNKGTSYAEDEMCMGNNSEKNKDVNDTSYSEDEILENNSEKNKVQFNDTSYSDYEMLQDNSQKDNGLISHSDMSSSDAGTLHDNSEKSDDEESNCSEEFTIVESTQTFNDMKQNDSEELINDETHKVEQRNGANLTQKEDENSQNCEKNFNQNERNLQTTTTNDNNSLPQVVSVHFYDPQNHCQRVIDPNTHVTQYPANDVTHLMLNTPTQPKSTPPPTQQPSVSYNHLRNTPSQSHFTKTTTVTFTRPSHTQYVPSAPQVPPNHTSPGVNSIANKSTKLANVNGVPQQPPNVTYIPDVPQKSPVTPYSADFPTSSGTRIQLPSTLCNKLQTEGIAPASPSHQSTARNSTTIGKDEHEISEIENKKRRRFIFGADEPPRKKVISSLLTPLCEREATKLADGIHEVNMQYFPLRSLAQKAASKVSEETDDVMKLIEQKIQLKTKIHDVDKARNLLKNIYDMVLKSKEIEDIQNFELVSHNFGVRNILNHLSLVDLYFGELGTELESKL